MYNACKSTSEFTEDLKASKIEEVIIMGITLAFKSKETHTWSLSERSFYSDEVLLKLLEDSNTKYSCLPISDVTLGVVMVNIILPFWFVKWFFNKLVPPTEIKRVQSLQNDGVTFSDIGGNEDAKRSLQDIAKYLGTPEKYKSLGIRLPKGILLYGPPGTGKTLLAKAFANECRVHFLYASGADFVEIYVGVGPKKIREMFKQARSLGKCVIFIDEIDSLGYKRGSGTNIEFDNTLNQLLTEMDGFNGSEGFTVIGATNQPERIDPALLRPGRFDRKIEIEVPDLDTRKDILKIHLRKKRFFDEEVIAEIAENTEGLNGSELENIANEAAFDALNNNSEVIQRGNLMNAMEKIFEQKKSIEQMNEGEMLLFNNPFIKPKVISK